jgi:signal transduction histidine kinase
MIVKVNALPQTGMTIVQITNWGLGIPLEEFDRIFKPYVRGIVHDSRKAIRGMGFGLFISKQIISAHRGKIFCHHSTSTLDDPNRRERWEGFETTFEVRLPHDLRVGTHDYDWESI